MDSKTEFTEILKKSETEPVPVTPNIVASAEDRLEGAIGSWIKSLETFEDLVETMTKKGLRRAIKAAYAHPLEHERISLGGAEEKKVLQMFALRDADKLNAALAHMEIEGRKLQQTNEGDKNE